MMKNNMIFDTHTHYLDESFGDDRADVLAGIREKGVGYICEIAASYVDSQQIYDLLESSYDEAYPKIYGALGVHPYDVANLTQEGLHMIMDYASHSDVVAIGEIGLDYHYKNIDKDLQKDWFIKQLRAADELGMPVVIHSRDALADTVDIMDKYHNYENGGVIHCFSYAKDTAKHFADKGMYIGVGGVVTFKNGKKLKEAIHELDIHSIVLETDCPYLSPEPYRGKRNDSGNLKYVIEAIAGIKGMESEDVISITMQNARDLYKIS